MPLEWDVIVVGAGIIGCAVARELARRGLRIGIIEARAVAAGATRASAGVLAPYIEAPHDGDFHTLAVRSLALYDGFVADLQQETGRSIEYRRCGTLEVANGNDSRARLAAVAAWAQAAGVEARWLDGAEVARLEPGLAAVDGALLVPSHGYVGAEALSASLFESAQRHGATFITERVERIDFEEEGVSVKAGGSVRRAARAVVAAGSWSAALRPGDTPHVKPVRGQLLRLRWDPCPIGRILWSDDCYVVPWTDGTVLIGATVEDVGFDERTTAGGVRDLLDAACGLMPRIRGASFIEARAGLRPSTPDGLPIIGESPASAAIVYATGHYRNGILLAPLTALLVADLIDGRRDPALDVTTPARFA